MMFNATFNNIQLYGGGQFYWWRKQEFPEVTDNNTSSWYEKGHILIYLSHILPGQIIIKA
jgi:hypothetical protein